MDHVYLFLDIDGVLNNLGFIANAPKNTSDRDSHKAKHIDPSKVLLLNSWLSIHPCIVILSSSWRVNGVENVNRWLKMNGATFELSDSTDRLYLDDDTRCDEISRFLKNNYILKKNVIVLDDGADAAIPGYEHNFVKTSIDEGLTPAHLVKLSVVYSKIIND